MRIGVAREIKPQEYRVALTPAGAQALAADGHQVLIEGGAGAGSGFSDDDYAAAGAGVVDRATLFADAELVVKVKEPLPSEYELLRPGQILFTYLHLAPNRLLTAALLERRVVAFAYETLEEAGGLPLLAPMSEIAGRMAPLVGSYFLQRPGGGAGILPCGTNGVAPARALILGAGTVGHAAARICHGLGLETIVLNRGTARLQQIERDFAGAVAVRPLDPPALAEELGRADLVVGALYATGGRTPVLIRRDDLRRMRPGTVIVDVAIDQGGCAETSRPTTHDEPTFVIDGIVHYCVANMPGAYPRTSTLALVGATLPYIRQLAAAGGAAFTPALQSALNLREGVIVHPVLAAAWSAGA